MMRSSAGVRRTCVALVVALLSLGLVVMQPAVSQAASYYGVPADATVHWGGRGSFHPWSGGDCNVRAYYAVHDSSAGVKYSISCGGAWNSHFNNVDAGLAFEGVNAAGQNCSYSDVATTSDSGKMSGTAAQGLISGQSTCNASQVCLQLDKAQDLAADIHYARTCAAIGLGEVPGQPVANDGTCDGLTVAKPVVDDPTYEAIGDGSFQWRAHVHLSATQTTPLPDGKFLEAYVVVQDISGEGREDGTWKYGDWVGTYSGPDIGIQPFAFPTTPGTANTTVLLGNVGGGAYYDSTPRPDRLWGKVIGVGVIAENDSGNPTAVTQLYAPGKYQAGGMAGLTLPGQCTFYWGAKIAAPYNVTPGAENPAGDLGAGSSGPPSGGGSSTDPAPADPDQPTATSSSCNFAITDPSTWLSGGMCAAVQLLDALVTAVGKVVDGVASVADAVLGLAGQLAGMMRDLFVPSGNAFDFSGVSAQWSSRPPGTLIAAAWSTTAGAAAGLQDASGCAPISFGTGNQSGARITCSGLRGSGGGAALYALASLALIGATAIDAARFFASTVEK